MTAGVTGILLGLLAGVGVVLVVSYAPPFRSVRLVDRLAPYVHDTPPPSRLLGTATEPGLLTAVRRVFGPAVGDGARLVDRMLGDGPPSAAGSTPSAATRASKTSASSRSSGAGSGCSPRRSWPPSARSRPVTSTCSRPGCSASPGWSVGCWAGTGG
ncbi:hypothetical protein [Blastococcus brunescens]|uniref:Uncharacterized protein n=1 Tax=Blastococcus brunescens TaxID=1564165 RepID=A0ABZ1B2F6_9ACTN|nr:hypothetical protein [Blastococcus sp. BMG 8361]WRL65006.1 hypothetical protein U6N30_04650 [Blastococcus sp. BMG 8361]